VEIGLRHYGKPSWVASARAATDYLVIGDTVQLDEPHWRGSPGIEAIVVSDEPRDPGSAEGAAAEGCSIPHTRGEVRVQPGQLVIVWTWSRREGLRTPEILRMRSLGRVHSLLCPEAIHVPKGGLNPHLRGTWP